LLKIYVQVNVVNIPEIYIHAYILLNQSRCVQFSFDGHSTCSSQQSIWCL